KEQEGASARDLSDAADAEKVVHAQVARLEAGLSAERLQLLDDERKVQELADRSHGVDKQLRLAEQELQFAQRERESIAARQLQKTQAEAERLAARVEEISRQHEELSRKLSEAQARRRALHEERAAREEKLQQGFSERRDLEATLIRLREELADRRSRLTSLLELQKNFEGYGRGVKAILLRDEDERRRDGVYG